METFFFLKAITISKVIYSFFFYHLEFYNIDLLFKKGLTNGSLLISFKRGCLVLELSVFIVSVLNPALPF